MSAELDLSKLSHAEKDALILTLLARLDEAHKLIAELQARIDDLTRPGKTPNNSSVPPSKGHKPNRPDKAKREGPRKGSLGRKGGGRALTAEPDEVVLAKPSRCHHCQHAFVDADQRLDTRYDKIDLPRVRPTVTRVERYAAECPRCGATTLAPVPEGLEPGTPFSVNIVALAMYLRFVHAVSYKRLTRLLMELFGLAISEGALNAAFRRGKPQFDANVAAILARLRRARVIYSDETGVRIDGRGHWNWVFQNADVVIHVVRRSRGADVVAEVLAGHRPALWVSDLYGAQQGHADQWQVCLAHQLRDCQYAIEAGDAVFAPRMKALLLRAVVLARRHRDLTSIEEGSNLYYSLNGDDSRLPDAASAQNLGGVTGIAFLTNQVFGVGSGNDSIAGGDVGYHVLLGSGADTVSLGNGDNGVSGGNGNDVVTVGNGANTVTLGDGNDVVVVGSGNDRVTVGNGLDFIYGGSGIDVLGAGSGNDVLVSFSGTTTLSGGGGADTFQVRSGNEITDFIAGDTIELVATGPYDRIDDAVISTANGQTQIKTYDTVDNAISLSLTLDGTYAPGSFFGAQLSGTTNYLELTYTGPNPTTLYQGIRTAIFDVSNVVDNARSAAVNYAQDYATKKVSTSLASYLVRGMVMKLPFAAENLVSLSYDFGVATAKLVQGSISDSQYATDIAKSLADWIPFGSNVAAIGSDIISKMIDDYYNDLDEQIKGLPSNFATVPIKILSPPADQTTIGNTILLNDPLRYRPSPGLTPTTRSFRRSMS